MAKTYVPGPATIFVTTGAAGVWQGLGISENGVAIATNTQLEKVTTDLSGPLIGLDYQYFAEEAYVDITLILYNESVFRALLARTAGVGLSGGMINQVPGSIIPGQIGALMGLENLAIELLIVCPYANKTVFADMIPCFHFKMCWAEGQIVVPLSTRVKRPKLQFHCVPLWDLALGTASLFETVMPAGVTGVSI